MCVSFNTFYSLILPKLTPKKRVFDLCEFPYILFIMENAYFFVFRFFFPRD